MDKFPAGWRDFIVQQISEPAEHTLRIVLAEAEASPCLVEVIGTGLKAYPLEINSKCFFFEAVWKGYVSYTVLNENFTSVGPKKSQDGAYISMLEVIDDSDYMKYLTSVSFANSRHTGPMTHYRLCSLTHIFDIVSATPPVFRSISPHEFISREA